MEWRSKLRRIDWEPHWRSIWDSPPRLLAVVLAALYATILFFGFSWSRCFFSACPNVAKLAVFQPGGAPVLLDRNGEVIAGNQPAYQLELVPEEVSDLDDTLARLCDELLHGAPGAMTMLKAASAEFASPSLSEIIGHRPPHSTKTPEAIEGIASFREKRKPRFEGR